MTPSQLQALAAFRRGLSDLASSLAVINPHETPMATVPEDIITDGFDEALTSGERCAAFEIAAVLRLYSLPEKKGEAKC